jgi:hypothetical protein
MSESWKDGYRRALYGHVIRWGSFPGGFVPESHYDDAGHMLGCIPDYAASRLEESAWEDYGSMDDVSPTYHGLDAEITCICGRVEGLKLRVRATVSEILLSLLNEED